MKEREEAMIPDPVEEIARRHAGVKESRWRHWSAPSVQAHKDRATLLTLLAAERQRADAERRGGQWHSDEEIRAMGEILTDFRNRAIAAEARVAALEQALREAAGVWDWLVDQMMDPHSSAYVDWDAFEAFALKADLITETRYDPDKHGPDFDAVEPGDVFFVLTPKGRRLAALAP